jgi:hypothetical protein
MITLLVILFVCCSLGALGSYLETGRNRSVEWHSIHGKWRVIYPDGKRSQRFTKEVANDYRDIFGGQVVRADRNNNRAK